jgi:phosphomannomutase
VASCCWPRSRGPASRARRRGRAGRAGPRLPDGVVPQPEEPGATDLLLALAERTGADVAIASDPDADRVAVAVGGRLLRGDEVGVLLADHLLAHGRRGRLATTVVSSSMLARLATAYDVPFTQTLTGFKWLARAGDDLVYAYEEALGVMVAPGLVRDKDGISAAVLVATWRLRRRPAAAPCSTGWPTSSASTAGTRRASCPTGCRTCR